VTPGAILARVEARASRVVTAFGAGRMVWRVWGAGPPLLLLHGASGSWTHWLLTIPALADHRTVIAPDMPGYGDSDLPPEPHTVEALADIVSDGLDEVAAPPGPIDVAGFSFGGIVAGLLAQRQGPRVRMLVLVGPNGMALPHAPLPPLRRLHRDMTPAEVREAHRENLRRLMIADPARADDLAVHLQMDNVRRARFKSATIPESDVLLRALPSIRSRIGGRLAGLWGERDAMAAPFVEERRRTLAAVEPDLDFRVVAGAGHWVTYEAADAVVAALLDMLPRDT
jgi:pimeloyl-ACP methyl ester carboxylesterase